MKLKEHTLIILLLFIMLFVCISSVSAFENQTADINDNNVISIIESQEILNASETDDAVSVPSDNRDWYVNASAADGGNGSNIAPYKNFKSVLNNTDLQDGDTVYFAGGETYTGDGINVNLEISKQLNLLKYGSGEAVFDAEHNSRIFMVSASCINITRLTFKNGKADYGGALYFTNSISNSNINATYTNNTATNGGANYFKSIVSTSNIAGTYNHNTATNGGANYFWNIVSNSNINGTYNHNTATEYGGANNFGAIINSNISGTYNHNTATEYGGANNFFGVSGSNINGTYNNNTATNGGANSFMAIVSGSNINGTYNHNTATGSGGANYLRSVSTSNINGTYNNNTATNGGANNFLDIVSNSNISGTYNHNTATGSGGANHFESVSNSNINGTYNNNTATNRGGANHFESVSNSNINGTYNNNTATYGGANNFWNSVSNSNVTGTYINNTSPNSIIHFQDDWNLGLNLKVTNAIFLNNKCEWEIYARNPGIVVKDSWFGNNASNYMNEPNNYNVQMDNWLFLNGTNNQNNIKFFLMRYDGTTTSEYDNTLMPKINLTITTTDGTLDKSIVHLNETVKFSPTKSGISRVTAKIENATQTIEFTLGDFDKLQTIINNAPENSVINLTRNYTYNQYDTITQGVLIDKNMTINGNGFTIDAKGKTRIFKVTAESINITDITLKNGKADYGGAIYFTNSISNSNINATYINNTATLRGGANYFHSVSGSNITGTYNHNTATLSGGANYFLSVSNSNINGTYNHNTATQNGGANCFYSVSNSNINGTYNQNTAEVLGGANYFHSVSGSNISGTYNHNTATQNGGANCFYSVSNSTIAGTYTNNTATDYGGAIFFGNRVSNSNVTGIFINNTSPNSIILFQDLFYRSLDVMITHAIFLNNKCQWEIYARNPGVVVKDSWFGNNASNYMNEPNNYNVQMDNWLFLNATADYSSLSIMNSSNITFKLYSTNGADVSVFDNSKFPVVNLTLTTTNGDVDKTTITLDNTVKYTATETGEGSVTAKIENTSYTIYFDNIDLIISAPDVTKYYKGSERFVVTITDSKGNPLANESVDIILNGVKYTKTTDANGSASIGLNLNSGNYSASAVFNNTTINATVTILSTAEGNDLVKVFRNATPYTAVFKDSEGNYLAKGTLIEYNINGVIYKKQVGENGVATLNINLAQGTYIITATNTVTGENCANNITVLPRIVNNNDITKFYKNDTQYTVKLIGDDGNPVGAGEIVRFNINGVFYNRTTNASGEAKLNINLSPGDYVITADYKGCKVSNNIKVLPVLSAENITMNYRDGTQFVATLVDGQGNPYPNQNVTFNINGVFYNKQTDSEGQAKLNINLMPGEYIITSSYNGSNIANKITIRG